MRSINQAAGQDQSQPHTLPYGSVWPVLCFFPLRFFSSSLGLSQWFFPLLFFFFWRAGLLFFFFGRNSSTLLRQRRGSTQGERSEETKPATDHTRLALTLWSRWQHDHMFSISTHTHTGSVMFSCISASCEELLRERHEGSWFVSLGQWQIPRLFLGLSRWVWVSPSTKIYEHFPYTNYYFQKSFFIYIIQCIKFSKYHELIIHKHL